MALHTVTMSLSAYPASTGAAPDEDWGDSPYGSLVSLGPRKFKKKPVLVLDPEELARAHLAMALGGAEIMEAMPDPDQAQRPRQPSSLLGLAPIGRDDDDDDPALYPQVAAADPAGDEGADDWDEEAEEDGPLASWQPEEDDIGEGDEDFCEEAALPPAPTGMDHLLRPARPIEPDDSAELPQSVIPSIEEQLKRMRALPGRLPPVPPPAFEAPPPAPEPEAKAEAEPTPDPVPTIQRLEIDDWSQLDALKGFVPARESDVEKAGPSASAMPAEPARPVRSEVPEPAPPPAPAFVPAPVAQAEYQPLPEWDAVEDEFAEALAPVAPPPIAPSPFAPPPRHSTLRARLVDPAFEPEGGAVRESLLTRLWAWLTRRR